MPPPWRWFHSPGDAEQPATRLLPSAAAMLMPLTVLFVLTSVETNWIKPGPGLDVPTITKPAGYVAGNAVATALAFLTAPTISMRSIGWFRRFFTLRTAALIQILANAALGALCAALGAVYQHRVVRARGGVWIVPEYVCIYVGVALALLQAALLAVDCATTRNFNRRGHGYGGAAMQTAIFLANLVAIWTGFGALVFGGVEDKRVWHPYNSCYNAWTVLITAGSTVLGFATANSLAFIFFWLPLGVALMFVFLCSVGAGAVQRFDERPLRRIREAEAHLRAAYRDQRRAAAAKEPDPGLHLRVDALRQRLRRLHRQRLAYFILLLAAAVLLKVCSWAAGAVVFALTEDGWSYWDSLVFVFFTLLTVGMQGRVPRSAAGMPLYHAYTYLELLSTAAVDAMLVHILWNLVPWPRVAAWAKARLAALRAWRSAPLLPPASPPPGATSEAEHDSALEFSVSPLPKGRTADYAALAFRQATDRLEAAAAVAAHLRSLLVRHSVSPDDLREYDRLLLAVETQIDDMCAEDKPSVDHDRALH
ncbi:hypothetical protein H4R18_002458 [Coemansia javaensis]|uniref:Potassium channel domain-containing protein n=1 Tax=Coemansia javaensis TaxID=2761396 RepID=A0A9W8LJ44_9FUNG|nr:hypothetical protein H4R18_002458 [Coemansia javaensis]